MKNLWYLLFCSLLTMNEIGATESKELQMGFIVEDKKSYDGALLAIKEYYQQPLSKFSITDKRLECHSSKENVKKAFDILLLTPKVCGSIEATVKNLELKLSKLWVSFLNVSDKQVVPNEVLLIRFPVDLPLKSNFEETFREEAKLKASQESLETYEATRIFLKAIDMSPDLSLNSLRAEVDKFKVVRVEKAPLRANPFSSDELQKTDEILSKGNIVIKKQETRNNYLEVESFSAPTQGQPGWIQKRLIK